MASIQELSLKKAQGPARLDANNLRMSFYSNSTTKLLAHQTVKWVETPSGTWEGGCWLLPWVEMKNLLRL